jgi:hypothetical protein
MSTATMVKQIELLNERLTQAENEAKRRGLSLTPSDVGTDVFKHLKFQLPDLLYTTLETLHELEYDHLPEDNYQAMLNIAVFLAQILEETHPRDRSDLPLHLNREVSKFLAIALKWLDSGLAKVIGHLLVGDEDSTVIAKIAVIKPPPQGSGSRIRKEITNPGLKADDAFAVASRFLAATGWPWPAGLPQPPTDIQYLLNAYSSASELGETYYSPVIRSWYGQETAGQLGGQNEGRRAFDSLVGEIWLQSNYKEERPTLEARQAQIREEFRQEMALWLAQATPEQTGIYESLPAAFSPQEAYAVLEKILLNTYRQGEKVHPAVLGLGRALQAELDSPEWLGMEPRWTVFIPVDKPGEPQLDATPFQFPLLF